MSGNKARQEQHAVVRSKEKDDISALSVVFELQASFAGLVVLAEEFHPIPFRTRPLKPPAPMVLRLKPRESRSLPVLPRTPANHLAREAGEVGIRAANFGGGGTPHADTAFTDPKAPPRK